MGPNKAVHIMFLAEGSCSSSVLNLDGRLGAGGYFVADAERVHRQRLASLIALTVGLALYRNERVYSLASDVASRAQEGHLADQKETQAATLVVIVMVIIAAIILGTLRLRLVEAHRPDLRVVWPLETNETRTERTPTADEVVRGPHVLGHENQAQALAPGAHQARTTSQDQFGEILIPTEHVLEVVKGQKRTSTRKFFPGYLFVQMELNEQTFHLVKNTPKITGFLGGTNPTPVTRVGDRADHQRDDRGQLKPKPKCSSKRATPSASSTARSPTSTAPSKR